MYLDLKTEVATKSTLTKKELCQTVKEGAYREFWHGSNICYSPSYTRAKRKKNLLDFCRTMCSPFLEIINWIPTL